MADAFNKTHDDMAKVLAGGGTWDPKKGSFTASGHFPDHGGPGEQTTRTPGVDRGDWHDSGLTIIESSTWTGDVGWTLTYNHSPVDAVLKPQGEYRNWLPSASTKQGKAGNTVAFTGELKDKKTGDKPKDTTATFRFALLETSKEPGSCMDSPWNDTEPDLKILQKDNPNLPDVAGDGQSASSKDKLTECPITLSCFDGGAYSRLQVTADLSDGTSVTAHLEEDGSEEVRLPYDVDGSHIAYKWQQDNDAVGKPPESDDADKPDGNYFNGDGLTLWEKYRGFLEGGKHIRLDPRKKNLFICDTMGGMVKQAITRFSALTGIVVHNKLTRDELSDSRVINRNHDKGPHEVDQHGLLTWPSAGTGSCQAIGGPGPPRTVREVRIDTATPVTTTVKGAGGTKTYPDFIPTVVHELLHACNVWHHGQGDQTVWWHAETVGGTTSLYEYESGADAGHPDKGVRVVVMDEEKNTPFDPTDPFWRTPLRIWLGSRQGQHSGYEDCVMRYDCSEGYRVGDLRYCIKWFGQETTGQGLCTDPLGTGVNDPGHRPQCRYGDADGGRGDCTHQICVNDRYMPPPGGP